MQFDTLPKDLQDWLKLTLDAGHGRDTVLRSLRSAGYQPDHAVRVVDSALAKYKPELLPQQTEAKPVAQTASQMLAETPNTIRTSDRDVEILMVLNSPRVVLFGNLLSVEECEFMVEASRAKLSRSTVVNAETGDYDVHPHRTSSGTHFERGENEVVSRIERRISELIEFPIENGEPLQILHYQPGGEYKPHFDFFDPAQPGNETVLAMGGQRIATLIMYLNEVTAGGSTVFPEVGLDVLPRRGSAVYFAYTGEDGTLDRRSLHGGSPVIAGEKWIATKWLRQHQYVGPSA